MGAIWFVDQYSCTVTFTAASLITGKSRRRMAESNAMKGYAVIANDIYGELAIRQAARLTFNAGLKKKSRFREAMKRCSTSQITRDMQIQTTTSYLYTSY